MGRLRPENVFMDSYSALGRLAVSTQADRFKCGRSNTVAIFKRSTTSRLNCAPVKSARSKSEPFGCSRTCFGTSSMTRIISGDSHPETSTSKMLWPPCVIRRMRFTANAPKMFYETGPQDPDQIGAVYSTVKEFPMPFPREENLDREGTKVSYCRGCKGIRPNDTRTAKAPIAKMIMVGIQKLKGSLSRSYPPGGHPL